MPPIGTLNNVQVTDSYDACTLYCRGATELDITITGGTVYMQIAPRGGSWGLEEFKGPQSFIDTDDVDGIRFRNGLAGATTVRVNVTASA